MYLHECPNHKENNLYHLISLKARIPIPPSCPCFQHFIMKTPTACSFLYYMSKIPQNASVFWSDLKQATNRNNIELVIFQKILICYMHYRNNIMYQNKEEIQVTTAENYIQRWRGKHVVIKMYLSRTMH